MISQTSLERVRIEYHFRRILLTGSPAAIEVEAQRILRRFRDSACPYRRSGHGERHVELSPCA